LFFGLKWYYEMEGGWVFFFFVILEVWHHTPHSIDIKLCFNL
jgi:hypothetical protein